MKKLALLLLLITNFVFSQGLPPAYFVDGIGANIIELDTLTTAQRDVKTLNTAKATLIFNSDLNELQINNGLGWSSFGGELDLTANYTWTGIHDFNGGANFFNEKVKITSQPSVEVVFGTQKTTQLYNEFEFINGSNRLHIMPSPNMTGNLNLYTPYMTANDTIATKSDLFDGSNLIPYTGAIDNVDLNNKNLSGVNFLYTDNIQLTGNQRIFLNGAGDKYFKGIGTTNWETDIPLKYASTGFVGAFDDNSLMPKSYIDSFTEKQYLINNLSDLDYLITNTTTGLWIVNADVTLDANKTLPTGVVLSFNNSQLNLNGFTLTGTNTVLLSAPTQIFNNTADVEGTWDIEYAYFEWFGAVGDGTTNDSPAISTCFNTPFTKFKGVNDAVYTIGSQIVLPVDKACKIDLDGATLKRMSTYTTAEAAINEQTNDEVFELKNGNILDESGVSESFILSFIGKNFKIENIYAETQGSLCHVYQTEDVKILDNTIKNALLTPIIGSFLCSISDSSNVLIENNITINTHTGLAVQANGTLSSNSVHILGNKFLKTQDTGVFARIVGTGGNRYRGAIISNNYFENIGKSAIKYTVPSSHTGSADLEQGQISGNVIKGYALYVISDGIAVFRDSANSLINIDNIVVSNNIVDGRDTSGSVTTVGSPAGARGIRVSYVDNLVVNNNSVSNCISDGIIIEECNDFSLIGNIVTNCSLDAAGGGTSGIYLIASKNGTVNSSSTGHQNTSDGIHIYKTQSITVSGVYSNNTNYGLFESSGGVASEKSGFNTYSAIFKNNTSGAISQNGESNNDASVQINCFDDDGSRHQGTATRRDAIAASWGSSRNIGYEFWNSSLNTFQIYDGTGWVEAIPNTVDYTGTPNNNQLAIFTDTNTLEGISNVTFDGTYLNVGIDGSTEGQLRLRSTVVGEDITFRHAGTFSSFNNGGNSHNWIAGRQVWYNSSVAESMRLSNTGNFAIGYTSDQPEKLAVAGDVNFSSLPVYADDAAAVSLATGVLYRTATGEVRIKL